MSAACPSEPVEPAPKRITPRDVRDMRAVCNEATKGPWLEVHHGSPRQELVKADRERLAIFEPTDQGHADATFTALARTWLPELLDEIEWLQKRANLAFEPHEA